MTSEELRKNIDKAKAPLSQIARWAGIPYTTLHSFASGQTKSLRADTHKSVELALCRDIQSGMQETAREFTPQASQETSEFVCEIDQSLLAEAKSLGLDAEAVMRNGLEERVKAARLAKWNDDNKDALNAWNKYTEENGLWCDDLRPW